MPAKLVWSEKPGLCTIPTSVVFEDPILETSNLPTTKATRYVDILIESTNLVVVLLFSVNSFNTFSLLILIKSLSVVKAMENIGAVTFRETLLLIDVEKATRAELSRSVEVIAHELAHMWFGDLVTMNWWDGIWLNEAFASLMEVIASEATYPEFKLWNQMNLDRSRGFGVDSLKSSRPVEFEVKTPEEAEEMFDVLTYQKGSTVLRMFETFIGEETFKDGVRKYLKKYEYKNTHSSDLWNELTSASSYNLSEILPTWIQQEGYPIVNIEKEGSSFKISQKKYLIDGSTDSSLWSVPLNIRYLDNEKVNKLIMDSDSITIENDGEIPFINNGGWSFFHSSYSEDIFEEILLNFEKLDLNEKYRILEDSWMTLRIGELKLSLFIKLLLFSCRI